MTNVYTYFITYSVKDICGSSSAKKKPRLYCRRLCCTYASVMITPRVVWKNLQCPGFFWCLSHDLSALYEEAEIHLIFGLMHFWGGLSATPALLAEGLASSIELKPPLGTNKPHARFAKRDLKEKRFWGAAHCPWGCPWVASTVLLLLGAPWDGRQGAPPSHGKGDFPEYQGIAELILEAGIMLLVNRLSPDPWLLLPHSILSLGALLVPWSWRQDRAKEGQPACFHMNCPCMLQQIQTACEPGSPGEPSAPSGVGEHRNHLFAALVQCLLHYI